MNFEAVIDIAAFIWDEQEFNYDQSRFYSIMDSIPHILNIIVVERIPVAFRFELYNEIKHNFPYQSIPNQYSDFRNNTISQLTKLRMIDYKDSIDTTITCNPSLVKNHYPETTQQELWHLINHLYVENERIQRLLTFSVFWNSDDNMVITNGRHKEIKATICDDISSHKKIISSLKKIFEHNPKHRKVKRFVRGKEVSALRCYNSRKGDTSKAQKILDESIFIDDFYYGYDMNNHAYIRFLQTERNLFHGHEFTPDRILREKIDNARRDG